MSYRVLMDHRTQHLLQLHLMWNECGKRDDDGEGREKKFVSGSAFRRIWTSLSFLNFSAFWSNSSSFLLSILLRNGPQTRQMRIPQHLIPVLQPQPLNPYRVSPGNSYSFLFLSPALALDLDKRISFDEEKNRGMSALNGDGWEYWGIWSKAKLEIITPVPRRFDEGDHYTLIIIDRNTIQRPLPIAHCLHDGGQASHRRLWAERDSRHSYAAVDRTERRFVLA